jgi:hypothetical protein
MFVDPAFLNVQLLTLKCDVKRRARTYIDTCISMSFLAVPAEGASQTPQGETATEQPAFRYNPSRRQSRTLDTPLIAEAHLRNGREN